MMRYVIATVIIVLAFIVFYPAIVKLGKAVKRYLITETKDDTE